MKKRELIEKIENLNKLYGERYYVAIDDVLILVNQLDEPETVKIPECAADVIEGARGNSAELEDALFYAHENGNQEFKIWYGKLENRENFARAWLDGYEVEKEKRYLVKFKGFNPSYIILKYHLYDKTWFLGREKEYNFFRQHHTHKELEEANFGWVFDCPGIEIEEVEEWD